MNALFEIGQKVVCVNSKGHTSGNTDLIEGKTYTVLGIAKTECCGIVVIDVGIKAYNHFMYCRCGQESQRINYKEQTRFVPLDSNKQLEDQIHQALKEDLKIKNFQDN